jgi:phosphoglycolate phosphatase-like HAD superfamily hydrolase
VPKLNAFNQDQMTKPILFALDFDGVICDSAVETAMTGWTAAAAIWPDMPTAVPQDMVERFRLIRPIIETGFEAILAMRLLHSGQSTAAIFADYARLNQALINEINVTVDDLKKLFGETRDQWIAKDLAGWVKMNPLFPGVAAKLQRLGQSGQLSPWYVVTTKQERFVNQILLANGITLAEGRVFGLDRNKGKVEVLTELSAKHPDCALHFVEDRLPTLLNVQSQATLASVKLFFALWGYNTEADKAMAAMQGFHAIHLENFLAL